MRADTADLRPHLHPHLLPAPTKVASPSTSPPPPPPTSASRGEILSFDNGSSVRILPRNNAIHAQAELGYNGTGLLQAVWEVADPASTSGTPVYRPLLQVREYLTLGDAKTLKSPPLPTNADWLASGAAARDRPGRALRHTGDPLFRRRRAGRQGTAAGPGGRDLAGAVCALCPRYLVCLGEP